MHLECCCAPHSFAQADKYFYLSNIDKNDNLGVARIVQLYFEIEGAGFRFKGDNPFGDNAFLIVTAWSCCRDSLDMSKGGLTPTPERPEIGKKPNGEPKQVHAHVHNLVMNAWKVSQHPLLPFDVISLQSQRGKMK